MSTNPTTSNSASEAARRPVRRRHVALIAVGAATVAASAGGIAFARGGADPIPVPSSSVPARLSCLQLAQMGPSANTAMSDAALAQWRLLWNDARC